MHPHGIMTDTMRQAKLRQWLVTYEDMLARDPNTLVHDVDVAVDLSEDSRCRWFKEEWGQQILQEYYEQLDLESTSFLRASRMQWLRNIAKFASGQDKSARPMAQIQAATLLENVLEKEIGRDKGEVAPAGKMQQILQLYIGTTTRAGDVVEGEVKVLPTGGAAS